VRRENPHTLLVVKTILRVQKKLKIEVLYDTAIPLLGLYPKEMKLAC
jgi:hypothetical protein